MSHSPWGCQESGMAEQAFTTFLPDFFLSFCFAVFILMVRWMLLFDTIWWLSNPRVVFQRDRENTFPLTTDNFGHLPAPLYLPGQSLGSEDGLMLIGLGQAELPAGDRVEFTVTQSRKSCPKPEGWDGFRVGAVTTLTVLLWPPLPPSSDGEGFCSL